MFFTPGLPGAGATLKTLCRRPSLCDSSGGSPVQSTGERPHSLHSSFPMEAGAGRATRGGLTKTRRKGQNPLNQNEKTWTGGIWTGGTWTGGTWTGGTSEQLFVFLLFPPTHFVFIESPVFIPPDSSCFHVAPKSLVHHSAARSSKSSHCLQASSWLSCEMNVTFDLC